ncbi:MAG: hypothetical protein EOO15_18320 [Chitinophagaceae bacterium]|nr:MAG: hypothetical protein EOO15_18320 [Chitinophagaceae bacterium]
MLLSDFVQLSPQEKIVILLHDGALIGDREGASGSYFLFQTERFYTELFYPTGAKEPESFHLFTGTEPLTPYLETISLESLCT